MAEEETGFESAIKAGELPYYCALTTLPDNAPEEAGLLSEDEQLRGYFAKQENLFSDHTKPQEAGVQLALGATSPLIQSILKPLVARGDWEGLARKAVWIASMAQTWGPPTDAVVDLGYDPAKAACASMQAIVLLAGYERVAKAMSDAVKPPIVMMSRGPWILVATEYSSQFLAATKANRSLFEKYEWWDTNRFSAISRQPWLGSRNGEQFVRFVRAADEGGAPIRLINILRGIWNDALILFDDKLQVLPIKEIVETPPASADPPAVSQFTATGDQPATPALQYRIGMMVQYQGDEYYVVRASTPGWDGAQQLAIAKDPNGSRSKWIRVSTGEVQMIDADTDMEGIQRRMEQFATEIGEDIRPDEILSKPAPGLSIPEKFFDHQKIGTKFLWSKRRALLADVPGLGKSGQCAAAMEAPVVLVSESNMKGGWLREINFWRPELSVAIIEGESPDKITKEQREADVVICNYNILHAHVTWMIARGNNTLVADEAQNLKNLTYKHEAVSQDARGVIKKRWIPSASASAQARAFWLLSEGHPKNTRMYLLSGTPMMNQRSKELFPYLNLIDENRWGDYRAFCVRYCAGKQPNKRRGRQSKGPACDGRSRSDELFRVLKKYMLRREKDLLNLPELTRSTVHVGMDPDSARKYQEASQRFAMFLREKYGHLSPQEMEYKIEKALKAEILTQMQALKEIVAIGKVPAMLTVLQNFRESTDRPVVIMCFRETPAMMIKQGIEAINAQIRQDRNAGLSPESGGKEIRYAFLGWGQTNSKKTTKTVEAFQNGEIDVVVCNLMSAKGITLTRAQDMYFLERAWRPADLRQAEDRIHRIGQKNACNITYLDCPGTVDESLAKLLALKAAAIAAVIDGVDLDESEALACVLGDMLGANMDYSDRDSILGGVIGALTSGGLVRNGRPEFVFGGDADI